METIQTTKFSTWLEVNDQAINNNINRLKQYCGVSLMAVVKANAYGHGLCEVAGAAVAAGAEWLAVSRIEEAILLREKQIRAPILVLGYASPEYALYAAREGICLNVYSFEIASAYQQKMLGTGQKLKVHAKIDSGMHRLGVDPAEGVPFLQALKRLEGLEVEGLFTHFPQSGARKDDVTLRQIEIFTCLVAELKQAQLCPPVIHAVNTAGALYYPTARFNLVRSGIAVLGLPPSKEAPLPAGFKTALTWKARLVSIKTVPPGEGISYNAHYVTQTTERIGVLALGYADGFRRYHPNQVLLHGSRVPVVGSVCMDQCMVNLDRVPEAEVGDVAVVLGRQGEEIITASELATRWQVNSYDAVCGIAGRVPRILTSEA
jgi:alanine racemase